MKDDPEYQPKKKMTYEEFLNDPFQKKKQEMEEFYAKQRKAVKTYDEKDEKIDLKNPFGQLHMRVHLAENPTQPKNIQNRQLNQVHILNK
jgi:hypothetical protein